MRHQASRTIALMLGVMIAAAPAAQAGTITYGEMVRTAGVGGQFRPASEVRLRLGAAAVAQSGSTQSGATSSQEQQPAGQQPATPNGSTVTPTSSDPTLSQSGGKVETVDLGDVTGTVCDCGEIPPVIRPAGGFPWWPLLGAAVIPFIIPGDDDDTPRPTPTPPTITPFTNRPNPTLFNVTPEPIPEPTSLFLFGSGLLAAAGAARRRYGRRREEELNPNATTEEV